jgi:hypothetical protein
MENEIWKCEESVGQGFLMQATRESVKYRLDLVGVQVNATL